jgi:hypothetical protein
MTVILSHPGFTDAQLRRVCELPMLRRLDLDRCPINEARLKLVAKVRKLGSLGLADTAITDKDLAERTGLHDLEIFDLTGTAVSDAGLRHLERLRGLTDLCLRRCPNVTDAGVALLQNALPNCTIHR